MTATRVYTDAEVDAIVATHTAIAAAHHVKYTDAEVDAIVLTHKNIASAHHSKYLDTEAVTAVATADDYVKITGDRMSGTLELDRRGDAIPAKNSFFFDTNMYGGFFMYESAGGNNVMAMVANGSTFTVVGDRGYVKFMARINNLGGLMFTTNAGGEKTRVKIKNNGHVLFYAVASGATQAAAGAAASEIWKTNGHATLPDNVLMIGV